MRATILDNRRGQRIEFDGSVIYHLDNVGGDEPLRTEVGFFHDDSVQFDGPEHLGTLLAHFPELRELSKADEVLAQLAAESVRNVSS